MLSTMVHSIIVVQLVGTEGLGEPGREGTMGNQVALVIASRKSPPID